MLKYLLLSITTALGHLDQECKNLQSTKQIKSEFYIEEDKYFYPDIDIAKRNEVYATIIQFNTNRNVFSNPTVALPHKSIRGKLYVIFVYGYDCNLILAEPIKHIQEATIRDAFLKTNKILNSRGSNTEFTL